MLFSDLKMLTQSYTQLSKKDQVRKTEKKKKYRNIESLEEQVSFKTRFK